MRRRIMRTRNTFSKLITLTMTLPAVFLIEWKELGNAQNLADCRNL